MQRPEVFALLWIAALLPGVAAAQANDDQQFETWYRTEVLIFVRTQADDYASEQWDFEPSVGYPDEYRYLIDPELAEERREISAAYESRIDERGFQSLLVPASVEAVLDHERPDALTVAPDIPLDPNTPFDPNSPLDPDASVDEPLALDPNNPTEVIDSDGDADSLEDIDEAALREVLVATPYRLLDRESLEFAAQARSLRRRGHKIAFHGSWWAPLVDEPQSLPIALDRGADPDVSDWPDLQGSMLIYRSRYLHIVLDLWLNTAGDYLPEAWQIDAPPLPQPSVYAQTLRGELLDPWAPEAAEDPFHSQEIEQSPVGSPIEQPVGSAPMEVAEDEQVGLAEEPQYPWRHAIVHRQSRRMRSGEVHYLDHPVIGVIVKVTPTSDDLLPYAEPSDEEMQFREHHQLPRELLQLMLDEPVTR